MAVHRAAVLGHPVAHSRSPAMHNAGYAAAGLTGWVYSSLDVTADRLPELVAGLDASWIGLSLTMPLKLAALGVASAGASALAGTLGAANTLVRRAGGWYAENTDAPGLVDAICSAGGDPPTRVAVLGAGGTARAALAAAADLNIAEVSMLARRPGAVAALAPVAGALGLSIQHVPWSQAGRCAAADLVISTLPPGVADDLPITPPAGGVLFDVVYDPWPTALAERAAAAGARVIGGLELLLAQAVRQFTLFTGVPAPVAAMRAALGTRWQPEGEPCCAG